METLGRYEIRGELGRGGMGVVYRAYDPSLDREVAIKSVRLEGVDEAERAHLEERLAREAKAAAKLQHPNIVAVHDFFRVGDRAYIVMEFIRGSMLDAMIVGGDRQNIGRIRSVLDQCASALDAAHAQGIIHRDVKPGNILIDERGNIKITDFGIARITSAGATQTMSAGMGSTVGTLGYMAPEQIRGEPVDGKADQFSLGVVAYQLFTGKMPFEADNWIALSYKIIHEKPVAATVLNTAVGEGMGLAVERALSKDPGSRFASCRDFMAALGNPAAGSATAPVAKKNFGRIISAAALLLVVAGLLWLQSNRNNPVVTPASAPEPIKLEAKTSPPVKAPEAVAAEAPAAASIVVDPMSIVVAGETIEFVNIAASRFMMGSDIDDADQRPRHPVKLTKPFQMAKTEVSVKQWNAVMSGKATGTNLPKANISWNDVQQFMAKLNQRHDGYRYRMPTEAEWEFSARANSPDDRPRNADDVAWYYDNSGAKPHDVGTKIPNAFGLQDMFGNVFEWTSDWFGPEYYNSSPETNPTGPAEGKLRIYRGGGFKTQGMTMSVNWRFGDAPAFVNEEVGCRIVRSK